MSGMGGPPAPLMGDNDPLVGLSNRHEQAKAQLGKVSQTGKLIDATRQELDKLVNMGDAVTQEDVIKGTAALMGAGADPQALLGLIANPTSPMPEGGQALAGWLQQQDQMVRQREAQFSGVQGQAAHSAGVAALQLSKAHHVMNQRAQAQAQPPSAPPPEAAPAPSGNPMGDQ